MEAGLSGPHVEGVRIARLVRASYEADLGRVRAFLPELVPLDELPGPFASYVSSCAELSTRYPEAGGGVRDWLDRQFAEEPRAVQEAIRRLTHAQRDAAMTVLSVLGHTYRWDRVPPASERFSEQQIPLPPGIAGPWAALARICGQPRVGTTWSLHLCNWTMRDRPGGAMYQPADLTVHNVEVAHNWLSPPFDVHLDRFSVSFVLLEAGGAAVLKHLVDVVETTLCLEVDSAVEPLNRLRCAIAAMTRGFSVNVRKATVDPAVWLEMVQPTFPWSAEADEPGRIEGGPSGIQLGTIQALDAALAVQGGSALADVARSGRRYMPKPHRRFLRILDQAGRTVRANVRRSGSTELIERFNDCVTALCSFRATHQARGAQYLRNRPADDAARASTGLMIGVDDDPIATFERTMAERTAETEAATIR
jgi:indoleamine 2,3-dioxygenase